MKVFVIGECTDGSLFVNSCSLRLGASIDLTRPNDKWVCSGGAVDLVLAVHGGEVASIFGTIIGPKISNDAFCAKYDLANNENWKADILKDYPGIVLRLPDLKGTSSV